MNTDVFAETDAEASKRFARTRHADPLPEIPPALLNTADLLDYIEATGMICPFQPDADNPSRTLKPASCAIPVGGPFLMWSGAGADGPDPPTEGELKTGDELILEPNSIVYVSLEPRFRLPDYIAGRYNLTIRDIYRGLLVGTGPLVDPGFEGRLSIPLHNLTSNSYPILGGEPFVWMEFTKLSPHERWGARRREGGSGEYVPFPQRKVDERRYVRDYVRFAWGGPIRSSIPVLIEQTASAARESAEAARESGDEARRIRNISIAGVAALVIALVALYLQVGSYIDSSRDETQRVRDRVTRLQEEARAPSQAGRSSP